MCGCGYEFQLRKSCVAGLFDICQPLLYVCLRSPWDRSNLILTIIHFRASKENKIGCVTNITGLGYSWNIFLSFLSLAILRKKDFMLLVGILTRRSLAKKPSTSCVSSARLNFATRAAYDGRTIKSQKQHFILFNSY